MLAGRAGGALSCPIMHLAAGALGALRLLRRQRRAALPRVRGVERVLPEVPPPRHPLHPASRARPGHCIVQVVAHQVLWREGRAASACGAPARAQALGSAWLAFKGQRVAGVKG